MDEQSNMDIRAVFTEVGCIMEDASIIALIWDRANPMPTQDRYQQLLEAHGRIGVALSTIKSAIDES